MTDEKTDSLQELLDQHDYSLPKVGDIRKGIIVAINDQDIIVDLGLKRDGLVPPTDLSKLDPEEVASLNVNDEIDVYILNTSEPDNLKVSINLARLNQDWIKAEELLESDEIIEGEVIATTRAAQLCPSVGYADLFPPLI
jgi:ribosomal protein S1